MSYYFQQKLSPSYISQTPQFRSYSTISTAHALNSSRVCSILNQRYAYQLGHIISNNRFPHNISPKPLSLEVIATISTAHALNTSCAYSILDQRYAHYSPMPNKCGGSISVFSIFGGENSVFWSLFLNKNEQKGLSKYIFSTQLIKISVFKTYLPPISLIKENGTQLIRPPLIRHGRVVRSHRFQQKLSPSYKSRNPQFRRYSTISTAHAQNSSRACSILDQIYAHQLSHIISNKTYPYHISPKHLSLEVIVQFLLRMR